MRYPTVFQHCQIGNLTLKNRLAMSQMTMNYATEDGQVTDKLIAYYRERARGGVGLIFVEGTSFTREGRGYVRQIGIDSARHVDGLKRLTDAVHGLKNDARIFLQIHHAGGRASSKITGIQPVAPSAVPAYPGAEMPRALTRAEVAGLVDAHVEAAVRARAAGFDGLDIHCAHGYLVPSFFSPLTNQRTDEYGGDLAGRTRFLLETIRGIKGELGKGFPLTIKISGDEYIEGGLGIGAMIEIARLAEEAGIDGIIVSAGTPGGKKIENLERAPQGDADAPHDDRAGLPGPHCGRVQEVPCGSPSSPWAGSTRSPWPRRSSPGGRRISRRSGARSSPIPSSPERRPRGGRRRSGPASPATRGATSGSSDSSTSAAPSTRPWGGRRTPPSRGRSAAKRVLVIGAGPAGMEAAFRARERGHDVTLVDRGARPGGQLLLAAVPPGRQEIDRFTDYLGAPPRRKRGEGRPERSGHPRLRRGAEARCGDPRHRRPAVHAGRFRDSRREAR